MSRNRVRKLAEGSIPSGDPDATLNATHQPPSTDQSSVPRKVVNPEAGEARNKTAPSRSEGSPHRFAGMRLRISFERTGSACKAAVFAVRI